MELGSEKLLPSDITRFLSILFSGNESKDMSEKMKLLVSSIGQDICRAVSEGQWKLPKHILLCVTVRHLFRSKQLTMINNRLGHSETYSFGLELETALAKALDEVSTYPTPTIVTGEGNLVFHCEWDNLNKTTTNVIGNNIVNSAGGIMVQEVKPGTQIENVRMLPDLDRSQQLSLKVDTPETLPPLHFTRIGPPFPDGSTFTPPTENDTVFSAKMEEYYVWLFCRYIGSSGMQPVPGLGGFISATGTPPPRKSTVDYFIPIHQPITDNAVVRELLKRSEVATAQVGQKWVLNTFDLGVCMKALPIIWRWPDEFANHVIMIGPFHTSMNFIGMLDVAQEELAYPKDALFIQDGMALLHVLTNLPPTCGDIFLQILDQMVAKKHFLFATDSYHPGSIKAQERLRRGSSEKIIVAGPATRKPYDFKMFLANDENKKQFCQLLLRVWSGHQAASRLQRTEMAVLIVDGRAHQLVSMNGKVGLSPGYHYYYYYNHYLKLHSSNLLFLI